MEKKETTEQMQQKEPGLRMRYIDDMFDIIEDLHTLQDVVETMIKVTEESNLGEEMLSGLNIINQSIGGIVSSVNSKLEKIE